MLSSILPRILSLFDRERTSATYGVADRQYASWCTIDFANGAYQGAAFGLARLWAADALPAWCPSATALSVIESAFQGVAVIRRPNGSMEEAFPYESSFCVTALVAHDLLWAHKLLTEKTGRPYTKHLEILEPVIAFLLRHDERHGIISNHLATAAGALFLWHSLNGDVTAERKGHKLLGRIRRHASPEGWFREYGGADPGYQTLCLHYLTLLHQLRPDLGLGDELLAAVRFLTHFALPDGAFGGVFGSRRTRLFYPSAFALLAAECPEAAALHHFMRRAAKRRRCVSLSCMDDANLIPMFNACAVAASAPAVAAPSFVLPCLDTDFTKMDFLQAGLLVRANRQHYTVISTRLGGAFESAARDGGRRIVNGGTLLRHGNTQWSTQSPDPQLRVTEAQGTLIVDSRPARMLRTRPSVMAFIGLRVLAATIMRIPAVSMWIKRLLSYLLMGRQRFAAVRIRRSIHLDGDMAVCEAAPLQALPSGMECTPDGGDFRSIHMASAGYWQSGDPL